MAHERSLPQAGPSRLGRRTIMDPALAARHGVPYVHLAAFSIDVDRVRERVEGPLDPRPFGWEVFLVEVYLRRRFDPVRHPEEVALFEDVVLGVLEGPPDALGGQLVFAIWDLIGRGCFPARLEGAFRTWRARPEALRRELDAIFAREPESTRELAGGCLSLDLEPPLAPPTREALEAMVS